MRRRQFLALGAALAVSAAAACTRRDDHEQTAPSEREARGDGTERPPRAPAERDSPEPGPAEEPHEHAGNGSADPHEAAEEADDEAAGVDPDTYPTAAEEWGERVTGVRTRLDTDDPVVALTFDACGGPRGNGYDEALIEFLIAEAVPATLFVNKRWIDANPDTFRALAKEPLFEIANHGTEHRPLSVDGRSAYGIAGTSSPHEVVTEVMDNQREIRRLTGDAPAHFRSGTAYCDEVAVRIVTDLGLTVVNFDVLGDAGATFSGAQVAQALLSAEGGSIALLHMNHPTGGTAAGVREAVPALRDRGYSFATLGEHGLV